VDFAEFVAECLVKNYDERPMASEVAEHPFLQNVPKNPTYIKRSLVRRINDCAPIRFFFGLNKKYILSGLSMYFSNCIVREN
jgi:hypothetical protein